jgi:hypothetical protein
MGEISFSAFAMLGAVVSRMVLGALWYSPLLFLNPWMRMTGITKAQMKQGMAKKIAFDVIGSVLMAFAMYHAIRYAHVTTVPWGLALGFLNWLGFVAVATVSTVTYEKRPAGLFWLHNGYNLISLMLMGVIIALWG